MRGDAVPSRDGSPGRRIRGGSRPAAMPPSVRTIGSADVESFVRQTLFAPERARPIVAVTTNPRDPAAAIDPAKLVIDIGDSADVVALETGEATWALSAALPSRLDVYGGAVRIWWPGLSAASRPQDHPLLFCFAPDDVDRAARRVIAEIRGRCGRRSHERRPAPTEARPARLGRVVDATVVRVEGGRVEVLAGEFAGTIADADAPLDRVAAEVAVGEHLEVRQILTSEGGPVAFSLRGVLQAPWPRIARHYQVGDVVRGRVCLVERGYVLVEVLAGAAVLVPRSEVDWSEFRHPSEIVRVGETTKLKLLSIDEQARTGTRSIKQAYGAVPRPTIAAAPGLPRFLEDDSTPPTAAPDDGPQVAELDAELRSAVADRDDLIRRLKEKSSENVALRKELRSALDRAAARDAEAVDPAGSENAFLAAVRVEYARRFDEGSRATYPLQRMRVGREFLARLRALEGVDMAKVVEVCAQVASGSAHEIAGRSVHELRAGEKGADGRVRASDDAKAWRCSLQEGTPSARRLHWWEIPGPSGKTVEFASVSVHDDTSIPS